MKLVGKAIRDYKVCGEGEIAACIGIAPWGMIGDRAKLINKGKNHVIIY